MAASSITGAASNLHLDPACCHSHPIRAERPAGRPTPLLARGDMELPHMPRAIDAIPGYSALAQPRRMMRADGRGRIHLPGQIVQQDRRRPGLCLHPAAPGERGAVSNVHPWHRAKPFSCKAARQALHSFAAFVSLLTTGVCPRPMARLLLPPGQSPPLGSDMSHADALRLRFGSATSSDAPADATLAETVLGRRTHRHYTDRPVPDALIQALCHAALSASSKSDFQQASLIDVQDPAKRAALAAPFPAMPWIGAAPRFVVFLGDARRLEYIGALRGHPQSNAGLEGFFNAAVDAALALQTFILCAEDAGLGCCPISVLRNHAPLVAQVLDLPRPRLPGRRPLHRLARRSRLCQHAPAARHHPAHGPLPRAGFLRPSRPLRPRARGAQPDPARQAARPGRVRPGGILRLVGGQGAPGGPAGGAPPSRPGSASRVSPSTDRQP